MASESKANKAARRRKMCAVFPTPEEENDLHNLKMEAEEAFCFEQYKTAMVLLKKFHDKQTAVYGKESSLVIDITFEYQGLYLSNLRSLDDAKAPTETTGPENQRPKSYCSKILLANAIREIEGRSGTRGSSILRLLREVFEDHWKTHGLEALPTLLVQRHYYMELETQGQEVQFRLSENAKKCLVQDLRSKLGAEHKLLLDLPNKLGLSENLILSDITEVSNDYDEYLGRARQMLESGAPKLALNILEPICTTALLEDAVEDKKIWSALILKAIAHYVMGETTKCHVHLHIVKELLDRFKAPDLEKADHEKQMRDFGFKDDFKLDLERIAEAENLVSIAETKFKHQPADITRIKERLAKVLLESFHNDQAFRVLMQVYEEKAAMHGPRHAEVLAVLDTICSPDMMHEFVSTPVLKELKTFLDKECKSGKLPNSARITLKARFFRAYLNVIVGDWCLDGLHKMVKLRNQYAQIQFGEKPNDVRNSVMRSFDAMLTSKYGTRCSAEALKLVLDLIDDGISEIENRHWYVFRCNQLLNLADGNNTDRMRKVLKILKEFYTRACDQLRPHDPVILHILKTIWIFIDKIRKVTKQDDQDFSLLKEASGRLNQVLGPQHPVAVMATFIHSTAEAKSEANKFIDTSKYNLKFVQVHLASGDGLN